MDELLTVGEVAKMLKIRRETVRRYIKENHLKAETLPGGDFRLRKGDVLRMLKGGQDEAK